MNLRIIGLAICAGSTLVGCGGGGSSNPGAQGSIPVAPIPTVAISLSQTKVALGTSATVTWSSTGASSCVASDAWSGAQATAGSSVQTPAASGTSKFTLTCTGAGGSAKASADLIVPIPVQKSSYENKVAAAEALGAQTLPVEVRRANAVAFADFFQDGSFSMVTHSLEYDPQNSATANQLGSIHFWKNINGVWTDSTATLLAANTGCLHPRKASVADFNGDGKPDVFFACHGFDAPPFPGESPVVLLSQSDGTYKTSVLPYKGFIHSASAADVDGDGYPDVVVTDNASQPYFLMNNHDGTFTRDVTRLPADVKFKPIFTAELIDMSHGGKYDLFLGGHEQDPNQSWPATILPNDGTGSYVATQRVVLPGLAGFGFPTDIVYANGAIYLARTIDDQANFYRGAAIQKIAYPSLATQSLYQRTTPYSSGTRWINWIIPNRGNITGLDKMYGISIPQ
jgi:hypothetical protein